MKVHYRCRSTDLMLCAVNIKRPFSPVSNESPGCELVESLNGRKRYQTEEVLLKLTLPLVMARSEVDTIVLTSFLPMCAIKVAC